MVAGAILGDNHSDAASILELAILRSLPAPPRL